MTMSEPFYDPSADAMGNTPDNLEPARLRHEARKRANMDQEWIADEFERIERELVILRAIKRDKRQPKVFLQMPAEVLKAHDSGIITKAEARKILGLGKTRQPAQLRRAK